jgi:hypothetical protein
MAAGRGNDKDNVCINAITVRSKDVWSVQLSRRSRVCGTAILAEGFSHWILPSSLTHLG